MKKYYNSVSGEMILEGENVTRKVGGQVFSGVPTEEQLTEWGFEEFVPNNAPVEPSDEDKFIRDSLDRMNEIKKELADMDYLTSKYIDGEDMSEYGDWQDKRKELRSEYRGIEEELAEIYAKRQQEEELVSGESNG